MVSPTCLGSARIVFFIIYLLIYFCLCQIFIAACRLSLVVASGGCSSLWCTGFSLYQLLITVASLVAGHGIQGVWASVVVDPRLQSTGSVVVVHVLSCSEACQIFPDQGLNPCPLHWQEDSNPLYYQESPSVRTIKQNIYVWPHQHGGLRPV